MWVDQIDTSAYTHIHFAFANITRGDFKVDISDEKVKEQFEIFKGMTGVKKIISFGGWDFSTKPGTFSILREAALPANRDTFKKNIIAFMNEHSLDGIDLDWEYPGVSGLLSYRCTIFGRTNMRTSRLLIYRTSPRMTLRTV